MCFLLVSNKDTYEYSARSLYGELFIQINNVFFPCEGWTDNISSVLDMWIDNLIDIFNSNNDNDVKDLCFMDGPYYIRINLTNDDIIKVILFDNSKQLNPIPYEISFYTFISKFSEIYTNILMDNRLTEVSTLKAINKKFKLLQEIAKNYGYII